MIPACWLLTCGSVLKLSFDSSAQSPGAGCTSRFLAVLVAALRSPVVGVIDSAPPDSLSRAVSWRIQVHCGPGALSLNSSLRAGRAKLSVYVYVVPSAPVEVIVALPGTALACVTATTAAGSADVPATTGTPSGTTTS